MSKIGFIVQPYFDKLHFGVRNFFTTIKNVLSEMDETDFLMFARCGNDIEWYRVNFDPEVQKFDEDCYMEYRYNRSKVLTYKDYVEFEKKHNMGEVPAKRYFQYLGTSLEREKYEVCIITNPWLLEGAPKIHCDKLYGLVYDFVPNMFVFTEVNKPFDWANQHRQGYEYYNKYCDFIVGDSESVALQYSEFYPNVARERIKHFAPFIPYQYKYAAYNNEIKENAVILAAPFDQRKGLSVMPGVLNLIKDYLDVVYVFGKPRCSIFDFEEFFSALEVKRVVYYPSISYEGLISLYKRSKLLFFPSSEEGLGIPLLEAQVCGCRIVTTDKPPMNTLGVDGYYYLSCDNLKDAEKMIEMLKSNFDYRRLSQKACQLFSFRGIKEVFF